MSQEFSQWLSEIRTLQQQLSDARQERDEAYHSASSWRSLYDTEAKQRREESAETKKTIAALQAEISSLRQRQANPALGSPADAEATVPAYVLELSQEELQQMLVEILRRCDRLQQDLKTERQEHVQTRQSLMGALGDTVDRLTKERLTHTD
ncbi:MAG: hypothetical protein WBA57_22155 [Elainellaceae cyanobacterium]